jgi:Eukaryotic initiation factor 4E
MHHSLHTYLVYTIHAGIAPDWDDPQIQNGGLWLAHTSDVVSRDQDPHGGYTLHDAWMDTVMHTIGEQFPDSSHVAGVALNIRKNGSRLSLWTRGAKNEAAEKVCLALLQCLVGMGCVLKRTHMCWSCRVDVSRPTTWSFTAL